MPLLLIKIQVPFKFIELKFSCITRNFFKKYQVIVSQTTLFIIHYVKGQSNHCFTECYDRVYFFPTRLQLFSNAKFVQS